MSLQLAGILYLQPYSSAFARWDIAHEKGLCWKYLESSLFSGRAGFCCPHSWTCACFTSTDKLLEQGLTHFSPVVTSHLPNLNCGVILPVVIAFSRAEVVQCLRRKPLGIMKIMTKYIYIFKSQHLKLLVLSGALLLKYFSQSIYLTPS